MTEESERATQHPVYIYRLVCKSCPRVTYAHSSVGCPGCGDIMEKTEIAGAIVHTGDDDEF